HNEDIHVPHLIRIAISHYQFETIHPFLDGNGRIGRLLIPLYLLNHGLLRKPSLYLSAYLEKHRTSYYDALSRVRESDDIGHWCRFFLEAVIETAADGKLTFQRIFALRNDIENQVLSLGRRAEMAQRLIRHLYARPAVTVKQTMDLLRINYNPANSLLSALTNLGILDKVTSLRRNRLFVFSRYLDVFLDKSET
ncbi:MAG: Fic family protein, partial [Candidatus Latescibacteria bacterium]|nr:Fic family protein [Candidatus Latescibacterota bacterium]